MGIPSISFIKGLRSRSLCTLFHLFQGCNNEPVISSIRNHSASMRVRIFESCNTTDPFVCSPIHMPVRYFSSWFRNVLAIAFPVIEIPHQWMPQHSGIKTDGNTFDKTHVTAGVRAADATPAVRTRFFSLLKPFLVYRTKAMTAIGKRHKAGVQKVLAASTFHFLKCFPETCRIFLSDCFFGCRQKRSALQKHFAIVFSLVEINYFILWIIRRSSIKSASVCGQFANCSRIPLRGKVMTMKVQRSLCTESSQEAICPCQGISVKWKKGGIVSWLDLPKCCWVWRLVLF